MKTWNQLFIRQGFRVKEIESNTFDCSGETKVNLHFLIECLEKLQIHFTYKNHELNYFLRTCNRIRMVESC